MTKTGLYFGTFNPIHVGHLIIANYMVQYTPLQEVWFVVSPQNPFKEKKSLLPDNHRLALVNEAVFDNQKLYACNIEFSLSKPSYTGRTLTYLIEKYPDREFSLLMGEDNLRTFHKWKNYKSIIEKHDIWVYPRLKEPGENNISKELDSYKNNIHLCNAPTMNISASYIRKAIKEKKDVRYLLTSKVHKYLTEMHFYEK